MLIAQDPSKEHQPATAGHGGRSSCDDAVSGTTPRSTAAGKATGNTPGSLPVRTAQHTTEAVSVHFERIGIFGTMGDASDPKGATLASGIVVNFYGACTMVASFLESSKQTTPSMLRLKQVTQCVPSLS